MPQQLTTSIENNFTKGLITESTGLNFPENAATDCDNCEFTLIGDTLRREGIDFEDNFGSYNVTRTNSAVNTFKWNNAGGDGQTQVLAGQIGSIVHFWGSSSATVASPISTQILASSIDLSGFVAAGATLDATLECQFSSGNGYLFIYHPDCDPIYCTYNAGTIVGNRITVQIRDFIGIPEPSTPVNTRPITLSSEHQYNLNNQGWTLGAPWQGVSSTLITIALGSFVFTTQSGLTVTLGNTVALRNAHDASPGGIFQPAGTGVATGTVTAYSGTSMTINITVVNPYWNGSPFNDWLIDPSSNGYISTWHTDIGNYPSNADVWWYFKDSTNIFNPTTTIGNVTLNSGPAPKGKNILNAFQQQRSLLSGLAGLTDITTVVRPRTGTWFQGRIWYTGVDAQQAATGDASFYTWTENIYFSQIVTDITNLGACYQVNDPTSETLFDLLPTDGGVIQIQGCGSIYKLFPIQNGMLVFAANGVWFITGSQGIGFSANDYTITKISEVESISGTSFVNVQGLPYFWNEEGIYSVQPTQGGGLSVEPLTVGTILTFYNQIPLSSKKYARGDYHPIDYNIQWVYKDAESSSVTDRYSFNKILNFNTYNKSFFPYTVPIDQSSINGINYIAGPGGSTSPDPAFKYFSSYPFEGRYGITFSDEHDEDYVDWASQGNAENYVSYFVTGYKLRGQAIKKFQPQYIQMYSRTNGSASSYKIQGIWDYANDRSSGRWSSIQLVTNALTRFDTIFRRHKIRGHGYALQFKVISVDGMPFDIQGWAVVDTVNTGT